MKSTQVYRQWTSDVEEAWASMGVSKLPGKACKWQCDINDSTLLLFVAVNSKYPWTVYGGGEFSVTAYLPAVKPDDPGRYQEAFFDSVAFFSAWTPTQQEALAALNRGVYDKIRTLDKTVLYSAMAEQLDCTPAQAKQAGLYETELEIISMSLDDPPGAIINPPLHFYDVSDLSAWAELVTEALPAVLARCRDNPDRPYA